MRHTRPCRVAAFGLNGWRPDQYRVTSLIRNRHPRCRYIGTGWEELDNEDDAITNILLRDISPERVVPYLTQSIN